MKALTKPAKKRAQRKKEITPEADRTIVEGVILTCSWGYEQTNIDFYKVLKRTDTMATIVEIGYASKTCDGYMQGEVMPDPENVTGQPMRRKVSMSGGKDRGLSPQSFSWARVWDGKPKHYTAYA